MSKKEIMTIEEFNEINSSLSELINKFQDYDHVDIIEAKKQLKEAGKRVSQFYYRIFNNEENGKQETTDIKRNS